MDLSDKDFHHQKAQRLNPSVFKRGIISRVNIAAYTADVQVVGSTQTILKNVPLGSGVPPTVAAGDSCVLLTFDETNPNDCVILSLYYKKPRNTAWGIYSLSVTADPAGVQTSVPHTLGMIPTMASVSTTVITGISSTPSTLTSGVAITATGPNNLPWNAHNIYVTMFTGVASGTRTCSVFWFVSAL